MNDTLSPVALTMSVACDLDLPLEIWQCHLDGVLKEPVRQGVGICNCMAHFDGMPACNRSPTMVEVHAGTDMGAVRLSLESSTSVSERSAFQYFIYQNLYL